MEMANEFSLDRRHIMDIVLLGIVKSMTEGKEPYKVRMLSLRYMDALHRLKHVTLPMIEAAGRGYGWAREMKEAAAGFKAMAYPTVIDDLSMIKIIEEWGKSSRAYLWSPRRLLGLVYGQTQASAASRQETILPPWRRCQA